MKVKLYDTKGRDIREQSRFHVKMIMGQRQVLIEDTRYKPLSRSLKLDVEEIISEANFSRIFKGVVEALSQSGQMASDETATCITFPRGTTRVEVPRPEGAN